jgi:hypothetical protein
MSTQVQLKGRCNVRHHAVLENGPTFCLLQCRRSDMRKSGNVKGLLTKYCSTITLTISECVKLDQFVFKHIEGNEISASYTGVNEDPCLLGY